MPDNSSPQKTNITSIHEVNPEMDGEDKNIPPPEVMATIKTEEDFVRYYREEDKYKPYISICEKPESKEFIENNKEMINYAYCTSKKLIQHNNKWYNKIIILLIILIVCLIIWNIYLTIMLVKESKKIKDITNKNTTNITT